MVALVLATDVLKIFVFLKMKVFYNKLPCFQRPEYSQF